MFSWSSQRAAFHCSVSAVGKDQDSLVTAHKTLIFLADLETRTNPVFPPEILKCD